MQAGEVQGWQEDRNTKRQSAAGFHYPHERVERAVEIRHMLQNLLAHDYVIGVRWNSRITASVAAGAHQRDRMENRSSRDRLWTCAFPQIPLTSGRQETLALGRRSSRHASTFVICVLPLCFHGGCAGSKKPAWVRRAFVFSE